MILTRTITRNLVLLGILLAAPLSAYAQIQVGLQLPRNLFIRYEPILATITIVNLTGRPLLLRDADGNPWFSFQIENERGGIVPARLAGYSKDSVAIGPGEALRRTVNITPIYQLDDFGRYRVRATVFDVESGRFFSSAPFAMEVTEGRVIWQQFVGHPDGGGSRQITLLAHRLPQSTAAYLRILDPDQNRVFATHRLGPLVTSSPPQVELDLNNEVHVLQMRSPRSYIYSHIGLNGEIRARAAYDQTPRSKPALRRGPGGEVMVVGGAVFSPEAEEAEQNIPGVSDRPVPLPGQPGQTKPGATGVQRSPAPDSTPIPTADPEPKEQQRGGGINLWPFNRR